jgi:hypothetical protein
MDAKFPIPPFSSTSPWISYISPLKDSNTLRVEIELLEGACHKNTTPVWKRRISRSNAYPLSFAFWRPRFKSHSGYPYVNFSSFLRSLHENASIKSWSLASRSFLVIIH